MYVWCRVNRNWTIQTQTYTQTHIHLTMNYKSGHIYQDFIITTHYYIIFYHFNNSNFSYHNL